MSQKREREHDDVDTAPAFKRSSNTNPEEDSDDEFDLNYEPSITGSDSNSSEFESDDSTEELPPQSDSDDTSFGAPCCANSDPDSDKDIDNDDWEEVNEHANRQIREAAAARHRAIVNAGAIMCPYWPQRLDLRCNRHCTRHCTNAERVRWEEAMLKNL